MAYIDTLHSSTVSRNLRRERCENNRESEHGVGAPSLTHNSLHVRLVPDPGICGLWYQVLVLAQMG